MHKVNAKETKREGNRIRPPPIIIECRCGEISALIQFEFYQVVASSPRSFLTHVVGDDDMVHGLDFSNSCVAFVMSPFRQYGNVITDVKRVFLCVRTN